MLFICTLFRVVGGNTTLAVTLEATLKAEISNIYQLIVTYSHVVTMDVGMELVDEEALVSMVIEQGVSCLEVAKS